MLGKAQQWEGQIQVRVRMRNTALRRHSFFLAYVFELTLEMSYVRVVRTYRGFLVFSLSTVGLSLPYMIGMSVGSGIAAAS